MSDLVSRLGLETNRAGFMRCPAHEDRTPSLKVYDDDHFYCFSCNKGGSVIDFMMLVDRCDLKTAMQRLASLFGIGEQPSKEDKMFLLRNEVKKTRKKQEEAERNYYFQLWLECKKILEKDHDDWNPELEAACEKIAYAEYRSGIFEEEV